MKSPSKKIEYPSEMTCDQMGWYNVFKVFQDMKKAHSYSKKISGQIYTQVDGGECVVYSRGIRYVNRMGCMQS